MHRLLSVLLPVICLVACSQKSDDDYGRTPIDSVGMFQCFEIKLVAKVYHAARGKINYSIEHAKVGIGAAVPAIDESASWIIFPESTNKIWICDGAQDVTLVELYTDGGTRFTSSQVVSDLLSRAPVEFAPCLPSSLTRRSG